MKITRETTAGKPSDYLHGKLTQAELVAWGERAMMGADFESPDAEMLSDIVVRPGLADVTEFERQNGDRFARNLVRPGGAAIPACLAAGEEYARHERE
ncbi:MAG: hypothetical protein M3Q89_06715 [Verrucomicrobiota bacterium]|nr:hypothetical protein [Verrucomicrobiota bacterium]